MKLMMICASNTILAGHQTPPGHPEHPHRITYVWEDLEAFLGKGIVSIINRRATREELCLAHSPQYIDHLFSVHGTKTSLDYETFLSEQSLEAILTASGICLELMEHIINGSCHKGFALIRPPGHHAGYNQAMGYCIINNMAVAVQKALLLNIQRIAIIDWDVHHGNGTQELFEENDAVLFIDIHQESLFPPKSGTAEEQGRHKGKGFTLNIPLPAGSDGKQYLALMDHTLYPRLKAYKPQVICVSSGFDALEGDLEGSMRLTPKDFGAMTSKVCTWADELCGGKVFMTLEGGYRIEGLSAALGECLAVLRNGR
jgi:acetoin utilization deacetylase AcuC-like enzyme